MFCVIYIFNNLVFFITVWQYHPTHHQGITFIINNTLPGSALLLDYQMITGLHQVLLKIININTGFYTS